MPPLTEAEISSELVCNNTINNFSRNPEDYKFQFKRICYVYSIDVGSAVISLGPILTFSGGVLGFWGGVGLMGTIFLLVLMTQRCCSRKGEMEKKEVGHR